MRFRTNVFFDAFWGRQKSANIAKISDLGRQMDSACDILERSAGETVRQGGGRDWVIENGCLRFQELSKSIQFRV